VRVKAHTEDGDWSGIYAAVAEVAMGKPWAEFDRVVAHAHALMPPDVRAGLIAHGIPRGVRKRDLDLQDGTRPSGRLPQ
jgi:hypothetical protein